MSDRDVDWLDQLCEADEKIAELESENAKLREQLNAVVDAVLHHRFQAESDVSLNVINYKLWDETAEQQKRRRAEIRKNRKGE
jgi:hypothetical protein